MKLVIIAACFVVVAAVPHAQLNAIPVGSASSTPSSGSIGTDHPNVIPQSEGHHAPLDVHGNVMSTKKTENATAALLYRLKQICDIVAGADELKSSDAQAQKAEINQPTIKDAQNMHAVPANQHQQDSSEIWAPIGADGNVMYVKKGGAATPAHMEQREQTPQKVIAAEPKAKSVKAQPQQVKVAPPAMNSAPEVPTPQPQINSALQATTVQAAGVYNNTESTEIGSRGPTEESAPIGEDGNVKDTKEVEAAKAAHMKIFNETYQRDINALSGAKYGKAQGKQIEVAAPTIPLAREVPAPQPQIGDEPSESFDQASPVARGPENREHDDDFYFSSATANAAAYASTTASSLATSPNHFDAVSAPNMQEVPAPQHQQNSTQVYVPIGANGNVNYTKAIGADTPARIEQREEAPQEVKAVEPKAESVKAQSQQVEAALPTTPLTPEVPPSQPQVNNGLQAASTQPTGVSNGVKSVEIRGQYPTGASAPIVKDGNVKNTQKVGDPTVAQMAKEKETHQQDIAALSKPQSSAAQAQPSNVPLPFIHFAPPLPRPQPWMINRPSAIPVQAGQLSNGAGSYRQDCSHVLCATHHYYQPQAVPQRAPASTAYWQYGYPVQQQQQQQYMYPRLSQVAIPTNTFAIGQTYGASALPPRSFVYPSATVMNGRRTYVTAKAPPAQQFNARAVNTGRR